MTVARLVTSIYITSLVCVQAGGSGQSCQDLDPQACSEMSRQNTNMCMDATLAASVCPKSCRRCPITCYNCNSSTSDVSNCNTLTCNNDQVCMVKEVRSMQTGQLRYVLGCADKLMCDGERKRSVYERSFSVDCCLDDLCNTPALMSHTTTSPVTSTAFPPICSRDIVFLVESSETFNRNFSDVKTFLKNIVRHLSIGTGQRDTHILVTAFGHGLYIWELDSIDNKEKLLRAIQSWSPSLHLGGDADIAVGIYLLGHLPQLVGDRPGIPNVYCLITGSNRTEYSDNKIMTDIRFNHDNYLNVITIGVGHANRQYLSAAATDPQFALFLNTTRDLLTDDFIRRLLGLICM